MRDYMEIGSSPCYEDCVQVNPRGDYHEAMREECRRFLELIRKKLGPEPPGAHLAIKNNPHDFGTYYEVVCHFDDTDDEARTYAFRCESDAPRTWADDHLCPEEEAQAKAQKEAMEGVCRECGEEIEDPELFSEHIMDHVRARQSRSQAA